jgi:hypothetical protein
MLTPTWSRSDRPSARAPSRYSVRRAGVAVAAGVGVAGEAVGTGVSVDDAVGDAVARGRGVAVARASGVPLATGRASHAASVAAADRTRNRRRVSAGVESTSSR